MRLQDKVAIITGAGRGIGQATAVKFATEGAKVVVCDLTPESVVETVEMCKETRGDAMGYAADVRDMKSLEAMVDHCWSIQPHRMRVIYIIHTRNGSSQLVGLVFKPLYIVSMSMTYNKISIGNRTRG